MGGIEPVQYNGQEVYINKSNAKEIYKAYRKGEVDLSPAQQHWAEKFLTEADMDEIEYDSDVSNKNGRDQINTEGADKHGNQTANATATTVGGILFAAAAAATLTVSSVTSRVNGWFAGAVSLVSIAASTGALVCAKLFDNGYEDRKKAQSEAANTNAVIDEHAASLEESMDMMNEDMENYQALNEEMSVNMNTRAGEIADLKLQLQEAQAAGNNSRVNEIKNELKSLEKMSFEDDQETLDETREGLEDYRAYNAESLGVKEAGDSVSEFLSEGNKLGVFATINTVALGIAVLMAGKSAIGSVSGAAKSAACFDWAGSAAGIAASVTFALCTGILGMALSTMKTKMKTEFECGNSGDEMAGKVGELNGMVEGQGAYVDATEGIYDESDEKEGESREKGQKAADKLQASGSPKPEEEKKKPEKEPETSK